MFIECPRSKSKSQRNLAYCVDKCARKCDAFHAVEPVVLAKLLRERPDSGRGLQLGLFGLKPGRPRKTAKR